MIERAESLMKTMRKFGIEMTVDQAEARIREFQEMFPGLSLDPKLVEENMRRFSLRDRGRATR